MSPRVLCSSLNSVRNEEEEEEEEEREMICVQLTGIAAAEVSVSIATSTSEDERCAAASSRWMSCISSLYCPCVTGWGGMLHTWRDVTHMVGTQYTSYSQANVGEQIK